MYLYWYWYPVALDVCTLAVCFPKNSRKKNNCVFVGVLWVLVYPVSF
jgi:hypothetical protein